MKDGFEGRRIMVPLVQTHDLCPFRNYPLGRWLNILYPVFFLFGVVKLEGDNSYVCRFRSDIPSVVQCSGFKKLSISSSFFDILSLLLSWMSNSLNLLNGHIGVLFMVIFFFLT